MTSNADVASNSMMQDLQQQPDARNGESESLEPHSSLRETPCSAGSWAPRLVRLRQDRVSISPSGSDIVRSSGTASGSSTSTGSRAGRERARANILPSGHPLLSSLDLFPAGVIPASESPPHPASPKAGPKYFDLTALDCSNETQTPTGLWPTNLSLHHVPSDYVYKESKRTSGGAMRVLTNSRMRMRRDSRLRASGSAPDLVVRLITIKLGGKNAKRRMRRLRSQQRLLRPPLYFVIGGGDESDVGESSPASAAQTPTAPVAPSGERAVRGVGRRSSWRRLADKLVLATPC